jgi:hypothetical protein
VTASTLDAERVQAFFERYLCLDTGGREHVTVLFYDRPLPEPFLAGLREVRGTRLVTVAIDRLRSQAELLTAMYEPGQRYLSVHDYCVETVFPLELSASGFAQRAGRAIDYTSFEFPRFDVTEEQISLLLRRFTRSDPSREAAQSEAFFALLGDHPGYRVTIHSGAGLDCVLTIEGPSPWMELCGPLVEGDIRFAPGSELFYNGAAVNGTLHCAGGVNLLPLRSDRLDEPMCRAILGLGRRIPEDPLDLHFSAGCLIDIQSAGPLAGEFMALFQRDAAFTWVGEVGIGMAKSAGPLIHDWAAPSNEAVPGVHVGLGANPGDPLRFDTTVHMDFVAPEVQIAVNGAGFYDRGTFLL